MLIDTGPLVSLIDSRQDTHSLCVAFFRSIATPPKTTWPCLTEASYLLYRRGGFHLQDALWWYFDADLITVEDSHRANLKQVVSLMRQYNNVPMDLADASIVALAESSGDLDVFTLDSDFSIYRLQDGRPLNVVPRLR